MQIIEFLAPHFAWFNNPTAWIALLTLIVMEVVLGIDNLIFISILTNKLPAEQQKSARRLGISAALILRLVLLATVSFIVRLTEPVFTAVGHDFSWRDLILIAGGLFLVWKATREIHHNVDHDEDEAGPLGHVVKMSLGATIFQILLLDIVFSIDSIITAVGMTDEIAIMYIAVIAAVTLMMVAAEPLSRFIAKEPDHRDAGAGLPPDDRHDADCRRHGLSRAQGLHLRSDELLGAGRGPQHAVAARQESQAARTGYALIGRALRRSDRLFDALIAAPTV